MASVPPRLSKLRARESFLIARYVRARVLMPVDGNRVERAGEPADDGHFEDGRFGEKRDTARRIAQEEDRINQPVRMIEYENRRAFARDVFQSLHLDAPEEDAQRERQNRDQRSPDQFSRPPSRLPTLSKLSPRVIKRANKAKYRTSA